MNEFLQRLKERKLVQLEIRLVLPTLRPPRTGQGAPLSDNGRNGLKVVEDAEQQARAQLESIVAMVRAVNDAPSDEEREAALTAIYEDPLDVEVRGKWHPPNAPSAKACEFKILLCTGGPAVRIRGELDEHSEPESLRLEYQNWFTPWRTFAELTDAENDALLHYCRQFYFAE